MRRIDSVMDILVISQFFPPEMGAPAARFYDFARHWIDAGHNVSIITAFPNFPNGIIPEEYRGKMYQYEIVNGIKVYRGFIYTNKNLSFLSKTFGYISFIISSILITLFAKIKYDIVISTSPPPTVGIPGIFASKLKRVPLIFDVRDIWPEGIVDSGRIKNKLLISFLEWIEKNIYRMSDLVTVVTTGKKTRISSKGVAENKIAVISNGVDLQIFDKEAQTVLPADLQKISDDFICITYAGVFNPSQGLDVILDSAKKLRELRPDLFDKVAFLFIGDGSRKSELLALKEVYGLENVYFMGIRPKNIVFSMLKKSYANVVPLRKRKDLHTVPSKIYESMASCRPVLLSAEGEPSVIVCNANCGLVSLPGDVDGLTDNLIKYLSDFELTTQHGSNGRRYCEDVYDRGKIASLFEAEIIKVVGNVK